MNLYIGNLSFKMTEEELKEIFEGFGEVNRVKIITDRETGRSRGFGFVEYKNKEDGEKATNELNGKEVQGRSLIVNESRNK